MDDAMVVFNCVIVIQTNHLFHKRLLKAIACKVVVGLASCIFDCVIFVPIAPKGFDDLFMYDGVA